MSFQCFKYLLSSIGPDDGMVSITQKAIIGMAMMA